MKKTRFQKPEFIISLAFVLIAAYNLRVAWLNNKWYFYLASAGFFVIAYLAQKKKLNFIWEK